MIRSSAHSTAPVARLWQVTRDVERWAEHLPRDPRRTRVGVCVS